MMSYSSSRTMLGKEKSVLSAAVKVLCELVIQAHVKYQCPLCHHQFLFMNSCSIIVKPYIIYCTDTALTRHLFRHTNFITSLL